MSDSESMYKYYHQKYYNSCSEINNCEHQIYNLQNERRQLVNRINRLSTDIRNTQTALEGLEVVIQGESSLNNKLAIVANKTEQAAANFSGMVKASNIKNKNITDVFGDEMMKTRNALNSVWGTLKSKRNGLNTKLSDLQADLRRADSGLQNIDRSIRGLNSDISFWKQQKNSNYYNMEYYRRKMLQEA